MAISYNVLRATGIGGQGASLGTLVLNMTANTVDLFNGLEEATARIASTSQKMLVSAGIIANGVVLAAATATAAIAGLGVKQFAQFENEMTKASAIFGGLNKEVRAELEDTARTLSLHTLSDATDLAKGYQTLASAGLSAAQSQQALGVASKFAVAGTIDLNKSIDYLLGAQAALKMESKDATKNMESLTHISDALSMANNLAKGSIEDFAKALTNKAATGLSLTNKTMEEGLAILAVYADRNIKGALAGEQLWIALRDLQRVGVENRYAFEKYNATIFDSSGQMRNMADILADLERAFGSMSTAQRRRAIEELGFQDRSSQSILSLVGYSGAVRDFEKQMKNASGTTDRMNKEVMGSFISQVTVLWNAFKNLLITVGQYLTPGLEVLTKLFTEMADPKTGLGLMVEWIMKVVGLNFSLVIDGFAKSFRALGLIVLDVGEALIHGLINNFDKIQEHFVPVYNQIVRLHNLALSLSKLTGVVGIMATKGMDPLKEITSVDLSGFRKEAEKMSAQIDGVRSKLKNFIPPEMTKQTKGATDDAKKLGDELNTLSNQLIEHNEKTKDMMKRMGNVPDIETMGLHPGQAVSKRRKDAEFGLGGGFGGDTDTMLKNQKDIEMGKEHLEELKKLAAEEIKLTGKVSEQKLRTMEMYNNRLRNLQFNQTQIILSTTSTMFNDLSTIAEAFGGKQSNMYKAMFAASKAFAIAESTVKIMQGVANAASLPWPLNLVAIGQVVAATASIVSTIQSVKLEFGGAKQLGGAVSPNSAYLVGERGPELFAPNSHGRIIPNDQITGGSTKVIVNNHVGAQIDVLERKEGDERVIEVMMRRVKRDVAGEIKDGRGEVNRALVETYGIRRGQTQK